MKPADRALALLSANNPSSAFLCGAAIGTLVWFMAALQQGNPVSQAMALMLVLAAPASFVFHSLERRRAEARLPRTKWISGCITLLGVGVLTAVHGLNLLLPSA